MIFVDSATEPIRTRSSSVELIRLRDPDDRLTLSILPAGR